MDLPQRKKHRLPNWDYGSNGYYFVTICTKDKQSVLSQIKSDVVDTEVILTDLGKYVARCWERAEEVYPHIYVDYYCVMPNHIHGILMIDAPAEECGADLQQVIHAFKSVTTRYYKKTTSNPQKSLWQSSFYDEIVRNDEMLYDIRKYIQGNPSKWMEDDLYISE